MVWYQVYISEFLHNLRCNVDTFHYWYSWAAYLQSNCRQFACTEHTHNFDSFHHSADIYVFPNDTEADIIFKPGKFVQFVDCQRGYCRVANRERLTLKQTFPNLLKIK